jgi:hypothetical protein
MNNLNLDVHDAKRLGADVNLDQPWIYGLVELSESLDKSDRSLFDTSEWIGEGAAWNGTEETGAAAQAMHQGTVDTMRNFPRTEILSVRRLHLAPLQGLDVNDVLGRVGLLHCR